MKGLKLFFISLGIFSGSAFGFGGVVTDPASYTYYVQQIEQAQQQYEQATKHLNTAIETKENVFNVERQLKGNYSRAMRHIKNFESWREQIKNDPLQFAESTIKNRDAVTDYADNIERKLDSYYLGEDLFDEKGQKRSDWVNIERGKKEQQQLAYKRAVVQAELARGSIELNIEDLEQLASDVNATQSLKDSSDVNSSILIKLLEGVQQTNALLADISTTLAMTNYGGEGNFKKESMDVLLDESQFEVDKSYYKKNGKNGEGQFNPLVGKTCNPFAGKC